MQEKDYYEILEVSPNVSDEIIKIAYKSLVKKYHPDNTGNIQDDKKIKEIKEAYEVLSNLEKRKAYDEAVRMKRSRQTFSSNYRSLAIEEIREILEKVSRMYVNIVDNNNIYFSSTLDIKRTSFFERCSKYLDIPQTAEVYILYGYKYSGTSNDLDRVLAITDVGIYACDAQNEENMYIAWEVFVNNILQITSNKLQIGEYFFSCDSTEDLMVILQEIKNYLEGENYSESADEENEKIIQKKIAHHKALIISCIVFPAFFYIKGWNNWIVKIVDASMVYWLCDFSNEIVALIKFDESLKQYAKWAIYGAGVFLWYILMR